MNRKDSSDPSSYCIDCSVFLCMRVKNKYHFLGSTKSERWEVCDRKRRKYKW